MNETGQNEILLQRIAELESENRRLSEEAENALQVQVISEKLALEKKFQDEKNLFVSGPVVVFKWKNEPGWPVEYVSPNVVEVLGYPYPDFISGKISYSELILPEDIGRVGSEVKDAVESGRKNFVHQPYRAKTVNGNVIWLEDHTVVCRDLNGNITHFQGYVIDISPRIKAEEQLLQEKNRAEMYLHIAQVMIVSLDRDGNIQMINPRGCEILGYAEKDLIGKNWFEVCVPDNINQDIRNVFLQLVRGDLLGLEEYENPVITRDGWIRILKYNNNFFFDNEGNVAGVLFSAFDVTEIKKQENDLLEARERADQANQAKSDFISRMSHELRTPMNAIIGFGEFLVMDDDDPLSEGQRESVEQVMKASDHLLSLINEILELAKIESGNIELEIGPVNLDSVVKECNSLVEKMAEKRNVSVDMKFTRGNFILGDRKRIKQVLLNFLSNAVKYNREGGAVTLETSLVMSDMLRVIVGDTGEGILPEKQNDVFRPFSRLGAETTEVEGTGIGLTISKKLIEEMGGRIGFRSRPGEGTVFWFELPLLHQDEYDKVEAEDEYIPLFSDINTDREGKILYIEDSPANIKLMERIFRKFPRLELITVKSAEEGIPLARKEKPDMILLDIQLPGMNGFEALNILRTYPEMEKIPVIAVSASVSKLEVEKIQSAKFCQYLAKPFNIRQLLETVSERLDCPGMNQATMDSAN